MCRHPPNHAASLCVSWLPHSRIKMPCRMSTLNGQVAGQTCLAVSILFRCDLVVVYLSRYSGTVAIDPLTEAHGHKLKFGCASSRLSLHLLSSLTTASLDISMQHLGWITVGMGCPWLMIMKHKSDRGEDWSKNWQHSNDSFWVMCINLTPIAVHNLQYEHSPHVQIHLSDEGVAKDRAIVKHLRQNMMPSCQVHWASHHSNQQNTSTYQPCTRPIYHQHSIARFLRIQRPRAWSVGSPWRCCC